MHLKNLTLLQNADTDAKSFTSVRFAQVYDAVTTRVFHGFVGDRMALKLNGKDDCLTREDFLPLARTIGILQGVAEAAISELTTNHTKIVETVRLPGFAAKSEAASAVQGQIVGLVRALYGTCRRSQLSSRQ